MNLSLIKNVTLAGLIMASSVTFAGKSFTVVIPNVGDATLLSISASPRYYPSSKYIDLRAQCETIISDLQSALSTAGVFVNNDMNQSTQIIYRALKSASSGIGGGYQGAANPNTVIAIHQAGILADVIMNDVEKFRGILSENTSPLKLKLIYKLAKLVISAHEDLDAPYFYSSVEQCRHSSCYSDPALNLEFLDSAYYGVTADLATKFISMYSDNASSMAHNLLEMMIVAQVSRSAAEVLSTSFYRRDYACAVTRLANLNSWIQEQVQTYLSIPEGIRREQYLNSVVGFARMQMHWAQQQINLQNCQ